MVKRHNLASGDNTIPGNPSEYYEMTTGGGGLETPPMDGYNRNAGGRIIKQPLPYGGQPAMYGVNIEYPNSNIAGIRNSINDGESAPSGTPSSSIGQRAPMRNPVSGTNPMKPVQRK